MRMCFRLPLPISLTCLIRFLEPAARGGPADDANRIDSRQAQAARTHMVACGLPLTDQRAAQQGHAGAGDPILIFSRWVAPESETGSGAVCRNRPVRQM